MLSSALQRSVNKAFLILGLLLILSSAAFATTLFSENFDTNGNLPNGWASTVRNGGSVSIDGGVSSSAPNSLKTNSQNSQDAFVTTPSITYDKNSDYQISLKFRVHIKAHWYTILNNGFVELIWDDGSASHNKDLRCMPDGSQIQSNIQLDSWHTVVVRAAPSISKYNVSLDNGAPVSCNSGGASADKLKLGDTSSTAQDYGNVNFDDIQLSQENHQSVAFVSPTPANNALLGQNSVVVNVSLGLAGNATLEWNGQDEPMTKLSDTSWTATKTPGDGTHSFRVWANESDGSKVYSEQRTVTIDTTGPTINFQGQTPADNAVLDQNWVFVNITTSEQASVVLLNWSNSTASQNIQMQKGEGNNYYYNKTGLSNDTYAFFVRANDSLGNAGVSGTRTVTISIVPAQSPTVALVGPTPADAATVLENAVVVNASVSAGSGSLSSVSLKWNGNSEAMTLGPAGYYFVSKNSLTNGTYAFNITATNSVGKTTLSETRTITIQLIPPAILFVSPTPGDGATLNQDSFTVNATVTGSPDQVVLEWSNGTTESMALADGAYSLAKTGLAEGAYSFRVNAHNANGWANTANRTATISFQSPTVAFESPTPADNANLSNGTFSVNATVTPGAGTISSVVLEWNSTDEAMTASGTGFARDKNLSNGTYSYRVRAVNSLGKTGYSETRTLSINISGSENEDSALLNLSIISPRNNATYPTPLVLANATIAIDGVCLVSLDSAPNVSMDGGPQNFSYNLSSLSEGAHSIVFSCTNTTENATKTVAFAVNTTPARVGADVDSDGFNESAIDWDFNETNGYELYNDSEANSTALFLLDGDLDNKTDFLVDTNNDSVADRYWDPDRNYVYAVTYTDVNGDGAKDYVFDSNADGAKDRWYNPINGQTNTYSTGGGNPGGGGGGGGGGGSPPTLFPSPIVNFSISAPGTIVLTSEAPVLYSIVVSNTGERNISDISVNFSGIPPGLVSLKSRPGSIAPGKTGSIEYVFSLSASESESFEANGELTVTVGRAQKKQKLFVRALVFSAPARNQTVANNTLGNNEGTGNGGTDVGTTGMTGLFGLKTEEAAGIAAIALFALLAVAYLNPKATQQITSSSAKQLSRSFEWLASRKPALGARSLRRLAGRTHGALRTGAEWLAGKKESAWNKIRRK